MSIVDLFYVGWVAEAIDNDNDRRVFKTFFWKYFVAISSFSFRVERVRDFDMQLVVLFFDIPILHGIKA